MPDSVATAFALAVLYSQMLVEAALVVVALAHKVRNRPRWPRWFDRLAQRKAVSIAGVALALLLTRALLLPILPIRAPQITDEHSYLLLGDTLAHGRLANPTHPMWRHFETIHVMQQPTYASMYQPAQGFVLAAGKMLFGHPWFGVWLSAGLLTAAVTWALYGWLPPRWALFGGILFAMRIGLLSYWMNSYWGGAAAATAGALVIGSLPRLMRRKGPVDSLIMGVGAGALALSRPFEGMMLCLGAGIVLLGWVMRNNWRVLPRVALPAVVPILMGVGTLGFYFHQVTGSPTRVPEMVQRIPYAVAPIFFWEELSPEPAYRHQPIRDFYAGWEKGHFIEPLTWNILKKILSFWLFYLGPLLCLPLVFFQPDRRIRSLLWIASVFVLSFALGPWFYIHYTAPAAALIWILIVQSIRHLAAWKRMSRQGLWLAQTIPAICAVMILVRLASTPVKPVFPPDWPMTWYSTSPGNANRAAVLKQLSSLDGQHLVIVRYGPNHRAVMNEWVYNEAEIDAAKVVWAREIGPSSDAELISYFANRRVWLIEADEDPPRITAR